MSIIAHAEDVAAAAVAAVDAVVAVAAVAAVDAVAAVVDPAGAWSQASSRRL
jgi:hypothetical protein